MANRLFDSVIVVDSAMGNISLVGGTSANITNFKVSSIGFWAGSTLGNCVITGADTGAEHVVHFSYINAGSGIATAFQSVSFPGGLLLNNLKCPTLTAGTAWIYLN